MTIYKVYANGQATDNGHSLYYKNLEDAIAEIERIWSECQSRFEKMGSPIKFFPYTIKESKDKKKLRFYSNNSPYCFETIIKIEVNE